MTFITNSYDSFSIILFVTCVINHLITHSTNLRIILSSIQAPNLLIHAFIFNICMSLCLKLGAHRQPKKLLFFPQSDNLCFLTGVLTPLTFNAIINMVSLNPTSICPTSLCSLFNKVQKQIYGKRIGFTEMVLDQLNIHKAKTKTKPLT